MEVADSAKARGSAKEHQDRVVAVAESQTTTEDNIREATTIVRKATNAPATLEVKAQAQPLATAVAAAIARRRKRAGDRFLDVLTNWIKQISNTTKLKAKSNKEYSSPFLFLYKKG